MPWGGNHLLLRLLHCAQTDGTAGAVVNSVRVNTVGQPGQYLKMGVLALLYTLQVQYHSIDRVVQCI